MKPKEYFTLEDFEKVIKQLDKCNKWLKRGIKRNANINSRYKITKIIKRK